MKSKLYEIVFGTDTKAGRNFDLILLFFIVISVLVILVESVPEWRAIIGVELHVIEWIFTGIFTLEYITRIIISPKPMKYITSFWGIIDLVSILPTFVSLLPWVVGYQSLRVVRALRLLRVFRVLKLSRFTSESQALAQSLKASYFKIIVFLFFVVMMMIMAGTLMYVIEGGEHGFDSIPASIYWAIVTVTTVGFGDITPYTDIGKFLASIMMILGYSIIAVPTGLITVEMSKLKPNGDKDNLCDNCEHDNPFGSIYCNQCGTEMKNS